MTPPKSKLAALLALVALPALWYLLSSTPPAAQSQVILPVALTPTPRAPAVAARSYPNSTRSIAPLATPVQTRTQVAERLATYLPADQTALTGHLASFDGTPLANAQVEIWPTATAIDPTLPHKDLAPAHVTSTDPSGHFHFANLPAKGTYLNLRASSPGLAPAYLFTLTPHVGRTQDLGTLTLVPTRSLDGQVCDDEGRPIPGAQVFVSSSVSHLTSRKDGFTPATFTNATGHFIVEGVGPGRVTLLASAPGYCPAATKTARIGADQQALAFQLINLRPGTPFQGLVTDAATGSAIQGARITLTPTHTPNKAYLTTTTDATGHFDYPGLVPGQSLVVSALATGYMPIAQTFAPKAKDQNLASAEIHLRADLPLTITVVDAETDELLPGVQISTAKAPYSLSQVNETGWAIAPHSNPLDVTDSSGIATVPLARRDLSLVVSATGYAPQYIKYPPRTRATSREVRAAVPAAYTVRMTRGASLSIPVTADGQPLAGCEVELRVYSSNPGTNPPPSKAPRGSYRIRRSQEQDQLASSLVKSPQHGLPPVATSTTDSSGIATFHNLPVGIYYIAPLPPGSLGLARPIAGPIHNFHTSKQLSFPIHLPPAARISGQVLTGSKPAPNQTVICMRSLTETPAVPGRALPKRSQRHFATTDSLGNFSVEGLGPGTYKCVALTPYFRGQGSQADHASIATGIQLSANSQVVELTTAMHQTLSLQAQAPGITLSGQVNINGAFEPGVFITGKVTDELGTAQIFKATTDPFGRYHVTGIPPGRLGLMATLPGIALPFQTQTLTATIGQALTANFQAEMGQLTFTVQVEHSSDPFDEPLPPLEALSFELVEDNASTRASKRNPTTIRSGQYTQSEASGPITIKHIPAGTYSLKLDSNLRLFEVNQTKGATAEVTIKGSQTATIVLNLPRHTAAEMKVQVDAINALIKENPWGYYLGHEVSQPLR